MSFELRRVVRPEVQAVSAYHVEPLPPGGVRAKLDATGYYDDNEVERVVTVELNPKATQKELSAAIVPVADRLLGRYGPGSLASLSFDKGFTRAEDRELLSLYVPTVVMPKRGRKNAAESAPENEKTFVALRKAHSAVESEINSLEHHGLNRCLDVGIEGYLRYVGYGVMSYNLHVIGRELLRRGRQCEEALARAA